jgi:hypothetical protein
MAFIAVRNGVETNIDSILHKRTGKLTIKGDDYNKLTLNREFYNNVYYGGEFNPETDTIEMDYDLLYKAYDSMVRMRIDTLYDEPFDGWLYPIYVPFIPANGTHTMAFKMKPPVNGTYDAISFVFPYPVRHNPPTGEQLAFIHDLGTTGAAFAEASPHPALKFVGKAAGYLDIGSQILFAELTDLEYGTNTADDALYARQGVALLGELGGGLLPNGKRLDNAYDNIKLSKSQIASRTRKLRFNENLAKYITDKKLLEAQKEILKTLRKRLNDSKHLLTDSEEEALLEATLLSMSKLGINITSSELADYLTSEDPDLPNPNVPDEIDRQTSQSVTSLDPNAIYGNTGPGPEQYLRRNDALSYLVTFENVDTAQAPAAVVRVEIQLDTTKFDLRRSVLSHLTIGGKTYTLEGDRQQYFRDIDLRPAQNLIVRVNAHLDSTGRGYWEFTSLDPITKNIPEDPSIGFLPPNVNMPEGEGSVSFTTYLKPGVTNKTPFSAKANIFFDANEPIETNIWTNTVDDGLPATTLSPTVTVTGDSLMTLAVGGSDAESGVERYALWMKTDTTWMKSPILFRANELPLTLRGIPGRTYSFYLTAQDSVGNKELKKQVAEATVTLPVRERPAGSNTFVLYPNPSTGQLFMLATQERKGATIAITDYTGRIVSVRTQDFYAGSAASIDLSNYANGIYLIQISGGGGATETHKVVLEVPRR